MKKLLIATAFIASSVTAQAGNVTYIPPEATALEEPARLGGSGAWLIPLVIMAVIGLALSAQDEDECDPGREKCEPVDVIK